MRFAVLFDVDGTLVDGQVWRAGHLDAMADAVASVTGVRPDSDGAVVPGVIDAQVVRTLLSRAGVGDSDLEGALDHANRVLGGLYRDIVGARPQPDWARAGALDFLELLRDRAVPTGLLTGNHVEVADHKLALAGLRRSLLPRVGGFGSVGVDRHDLAERTIARLAAAGGLARDRFVVVGDTVSDVTAAKAAGARAVAVTGGWEDERLLADAGADLVISGFDSDVATFTAVAAVAD